jgi:hypothetical protein
VNYTLKNPHGILGRISLFKSSYKLGEDITGALDLTTATIACLQVLYCALLYPPNTLLVMILALPQMTVVLQCLEEVSKSCLQASAVVSFVSSVHARHLECCHNTRQSNFSLPVPLTVTQSFQHPTGTFCVYSSSGRQAEAPLNWKLAFPIGVAPPPLGFVFAPSWSLLLCVCPPPLHS